MPAISNAFSFAQASSLPNCFRPWSGAWKVRLVRFVSKQMLGRAIGFCPAFEFALLRLASSSGSRHWFQFVW